MVNISFWNSSKVMCLSLFVSAMFMISQVSFSESSGLSYASFCKGQEDVEYSGDDVARAVAEHRASRLVGTVSAWDQGCGGGSHTFLSSFASTLPSPLLSSSSNFFRR